MFGKKKIIIFLFVFASFLTVAHFASAQTDMFGMNYGRALGLADTDPRIAVINLIRIALTFLGIIAVIIIMYGGWLWMTAAGDANRVDKAKKVLLSAVIGLILILSAFLIATFIINQIGNALGPQCTPACATGQKCCTGNHCCPSNESCCGNSCCASGLRCCPGSICATDCGNLPTQSFYINSKSPPDGSTNVIRNARIRFTFNSNVSSSTVDATTFTVVDGGGAPIAGTRAINGRQIQFVPAAACPANPCNAPFCLPANTAITVTAVNGASGILNVNNRDLTCDLGHPCTVTFSTGDLIDCDKPVVVLSTSPQICLDTINDMGFTANDDSGVSEAEFSDSNGNAAFLFNPDFPGPFLVTCPGPGICGQRPNQWIMPLGTAHWQPTAGTGYNAGENYSINLQAADLNDNYASTTRNFRLRPAHCCNGIEDGDETGLDCGGSCALCQGAACGINLNADCGTGNANCDNERCASGFCNCGTYPPGECQVKGYGTLVGDTCCVCENKPIIYWLSPPGGFCDADINTFCQTDADCAGFSPNTCNQDKGNGAVGNFVTIGGRNFGTTPGQVFFSDNSGQPTVVAALANNPVSGNPNCSALDVWKDNQIIVVVPAGALAGPVRVENSSNFYGDSSDNFIVNTILRPGLCSLSPDHGTSSIPVSYQGIRLINNTAYFGNQANNIVALNSNFPANTNGLAAVPNIETGRTTSYVLNNSNINSNFINFRKDAEAVLGPQIISIDPAQGKEGQYVTIQGNGFGNARGLSQVFFGTVEASYTFPKICADSIWSDNQVIVKVPAGLTNGQYDIYMDIGSWPRITGPIDFTYDDTLPLLPSLCRLRPVLGPVASPVNLWGEYFGVQSTGGVRFYLNSDSLQINFWGRENQTDKITAVVPLGAMTGPVRVVQGGQEGNGMNFKVGACQTNAECGGTDICCPVGTFGQGRCVTAMNECYTIVQPSVYEWDFSTEIGSNTPCYPGAVPGTCDVNQSQCLPGYVCQLSTCTCVLAPDSCGGYNSDQCNNSLFCPNSPGLCSPYAGGGLIPSGSCNNNCQGVGGCTSTTCHYVSNLDRCLLNGNLTCHLASTTQDVLGNNVPMVCELYNGTGRWHINTALSCPNGWTSLINNRCVNTTATCDICSANFYCLDDMSGDNIGLCGANHDICPENATCSSANQCERSDNARCECCCEIGQDARDCCAPLICDGTCGNDTTNDSSGFGLCTGCADVSSSTPVQDAACNCTGHSGKYCDNSVPHGVCRDCAQLNNTADCTAHLNSCCLDHKNSDVCRGGDGTILAGGFCPYYNCNLLNPVICDSGLPLIDGQYKSIDICTSACRANPIPPGQNCQNFRPTGAPNTCDPSICSSPFACMNDSGGPPVYPVCGYCCCDPAAVPDGCTSINPVLTCQADKSPCSGPVRGLCCGCSRDNDCTAPASLPLAAGCGTDTCCHPRPSVIATLPLDEAGDICRNSQITAEFDQYMNGGSFQDNVIVMGEYAGVCPAGTEYLARAGQEPIRHGMIARVYYDIKRIFSRIFVSVWPENSAQAYYPVAGNLNYCAISGSIDWVNLANDHTQLIFSPSALLDADTRYYVIIKGDENLDSQKGVKSVWGVGMNGPYNETFNGLIYDKVYIWSFETLPEQAPDNGVCKLNHVIVRPSSYLFKTNINDSVENDNNPADATFDTVKDSDKVFIADAKSVDNQTLTSIAGVYSWTWSWRSSNDTVADNIAGVFPDTERYKTLLRANPDMTEGETILSATAHIDVDTMVPSTVGQDIIGSAEVFLFVCDNPWPPEAADGTWHPWLDNSFNCTPALVGSGCLNTNYKLYYCRDSGKYGSYDDLPAIMSSSTIIRGQFPEMLKESYFFWEETPNSVLELHTVANTATASGSKVALYWTDLSGDVTLREYVVYYGRTTNFTDSRTVPRTTVTSAGNPFIVDNLQNNVLYYLAVTARYTNGTESEINDLNQVTFMPRDTEPPAIPANFHASSSDQSVTLSWIKVADAVNYEISYGAITNVYAFSESAGNVDRVEFTDLTNGSTYYFVINAVDGNGNKSATSTALTVIPFAIPINFTATASGTNSIYLRWAPAAGALSYNIYYSASASMNAAIMVNTTAITLTVSSLLPNTRYYFISRSINSNGEVSQPSAQVSAVASP